MATFSAESCTINISELLSLMVNNLLKCSDFYKLLLISVSALFPCLFMLKPGATDQCLQLDLSNVLS